MYCHSLGKHRNHQNKPSKANQNHRDYQDEQDLYQVKHGDSTELRQLKGKVKLLVSKLANSKKQKDQLHKANEKMQKELMEMQNNLRHMVVGFNNTSSSFPMQNELINKINQFYKCDCLDIFFDVLAPEELTLKGLIYFYMQIFKSANQIVDKYFQPAFSKVKQVGCLQTLEGPVLNVMRKSFQTKHQQILSSLIQKDQINRLIQNLVNQIGLANSQQIVDNINNFFIKLLQIILQCKICDPPLCIQVVSMGRKVQFSNLHHDPFDGFIKGKEDCFVILPQVRKEQSELGVKALVLPKNYDPMG